MAGLKVSPGVNGAAGLSRPPSLSTSSAGKNESANPQDTVSLGQNSPSAGLMDPKALQQVVGSRSSAPAQSPSQALAAQYAEAAGDRSKLEEVSDQAWNQAQTLAAGLSDQDKAQINTDYKFILGTAGQSGAGEALRGVSEDKMGRIKAAFPDNKEGQFEAHQQIVGVQLEEHGYMAQMLAMRERGRANGNEELAGFADTYLRSRNDFNGIRDLITVITPETQLGHK